MKRSIGSTTAWTITFFSLARLWAAAPPAARADFPTVDEFLKAGGFSSGDIAKAKAGEIIRGSVASSNERELVATLAFLVKETPKELMDRSLQGLLMNVDPSMISWALVSGAPNPQSFAKLGLSPDGPARAKRYAQASAGSDLNLSEKEIASFGKLESEAPKEVEPLIRSSLLARITAYQQNGLSGIDPYTRGGAKSRSAGEDLRSATEAMTHIAKWMPAAYEMFLNYPDSKAPGSKEAFSWSQINAHDVPTLLLTHGVAVPDGDAFYVMQRQFYVSEGYNCEQALAAFVPVDAGTAVFYVNRTSTDQVTGFGGGAKRSIGSGLLASQIEGIFKRIQK